MKGFLSGLLIMVGAYVYLKVGGIIGALLFSFGIISIIKLEIPLYTGIAGVENDMLKVSEVLWKNIFGSLIGVFLILLSDNSVIETCQNIAINKTHSLWYISLIKAIFCGLIVDISVFSSKKYNNSLPLLLGIPTFILCGFNHSIADIFYLTAGYNSEISVWNFIIYYIVVVIGNFIGCNIRRLCFFDFKTN